MAGTLLALASSSPAAAQVVNGSFESATALQGWSTIGDAAIVTSSFGKDVPDGSQVAFLYSGSGVVGTGTQANASSLATFLGTTTGALNAAAGGGFTANAGGGILQTFSVNAGDTISFDWDFLTLENRDGTVIDAANDFGFFVVNGTASFSGLTAGAVNVLGSVATANYSIPFPSNAPISAAFDGSAVGDYYYETADGSASGVGASATYDAAPLYQTVSFTAETSGTLTLGFGVVEVGRPGGQADDVAIPSTLLLDGISAMPLQTGMLIPEPGPLSFAVTAASALLGAVHRRRRSASRRR